MVAAGIFTGIAGLGVGYVGGVIWEQVHRHRRQKKLKEKALAEAASGIPVAVPAPPGTPALRLVSSEPVPVPELEGRRLASVRFAPSSVELEFTGSRLRLTGAATILFAGQRYRFPDAGSRDALCSLLGDRVDAVRVAADRIEIHFESGGEIVAARTVIAVA